MEIIDKNTFQQQGFNISSIANIQQNNTLIISL